mgnify:CR=1 FL=1
MEFISKDYARFTPVNSSNSYSPTEGQSIIRLQIPDGNKYLDGSLLRLNGKIRLKNCVNKEDSGVTQSVYMSALSGVHSFIQQITINSFKSQTVLERNNNYGRMVGSLMMCNNDENDFKTKVGNQSLNTASVTNTYQSLVNDGGAGEISFSIPLLCGIFNGGEPLPLSSSWGVGGLSIEILLCNPLDGLYDLNTGGGVNPSLTASFDWTDICITAPVYTPSPQMLQGLLSNPQGSIEFMNWSNLYNVINSDNAVVSYNLGLNNVVSSFNNYIKTANLSSDKNGMANEDIGLKSLVYGKGGVRFPNEYKVNINPDQISSIIAVPETSVEVNNTQSEIKRELLTSFRPYSRCGHNIIGKGVGTEPTMATGIRYDSISSGVDYTNTPFSYELQSQINETTAVFSYFLSKKTLMYNQQVASVM